MVIMVPRLAIEVTRRCNLHCDFCMRGEAQNIDCDPSYVDKLFEQGQDIIISNLNLSGGEPTLNEDLIEYIIDKIISEKLLVLSMQMTTNGHVYSPRVVAAFQRYHEYVKSFLLPLHRCLDLSYIALIRVSNDQYHDSIDEAYRHPLKNIRLEFTGTVDTFEDEVILAGRAKKNVPFGRHYEYRLKPLEAQTKDNVALLKNSFYLTATGFVTNVGDGEYEDMDRINFGRIEDFSFLELAGGSKDEEGQKLNYKMSSNQDSL